MTGFLSLCKHACVGIGPVTMPSLFCESLMLEVKNNDDRSAPSKASRVTSSDTAGADSFAEGSTSVERP
jgi:hypothetical protein